MTLIFGGFVGKLLVKLRIPRDQGAGRPRRQYRGARGGGACWREGFLLVSLSQCLYITVFIHLFIFLSLNITVLSAAVFMHQNRCIIQRGLRVHAHAREMAVDLVELAVLDETRRQDVRDVCCRMTDNVFRTGTVTFKRHRYH